MSEKTPNLQLPYILAAQAQKHVTHNEAIRGLDTLVQLSVEDQDLTEPPLTPDEGACYIVAIGGTGEWQGKDHQVTAWQDGAWMFYSPVEGWVAWLRDDDSQTVFDGTSWVLLSGGGSGGLASINPVTGALVGINATADSTNRLSINSPATLLNHEGTDHQLKINKNSIADNASLLFQTGFSGRAEFGLTGGDDFHMKVSPDGSTFFDGIVIDKDTGAVTFPNTTFAGGSVSSVFGRAGAVAAVAGDYNFDDIAGVSQDVLIGRLTAGTGVQEALTAGQVRSFLNVEDGANTDLTGAEIKTLYEAQADTNTYNDAAVTKLSGIEAGATSDQSGSEIKSLYEAMADTNAYDDAAVSKLAGMEPLADVTDSANVISSLDGAILALVTVATDDKVFVQDQSDSSALKSVTAQSIADLASSVASDINVGSDAHGDVLYFDGSNYTRLAAGTSGQFLKTLGVGVNPAWETISGGGDMLAANNLSDVASATAARVNLGLEIGVDVAAAGASSGANSDLLALALRVADLEGDALGLIDGIADPFDDETDVDTGSSINQNWSASSELYSVLLNVGTDVLPQMTGSTTGGVTVTANAQQSGSEAYKLFDNNTGTQWSAGQLGEGELLIDFGSVIAVAGYTMASSLQNITSDSVASFNFQKSDDGINFTTIDSQAGLNWTLAEIKNFTLPSTHSARYFRFANMIPAGGVGGGWNKSSEIQILSPGSVNDMSLQSSAFTADATPAKARLLFQIKPIDSITINTDIFASISRDGGVTWSVATLVERMTYSDGTLLYEDNNVDLSGQPAGTSMKWKLETANGKNISASGVVMQWS